MTGMPTQNGRAAAPPAGPQRGEQRVGGDDEQPDVDVVHPDPRLDEEHPVDDDEQADQPGDQAPAEQDPGEQIDERRRQRPGDDPGQPPGEGVRPGVDRRGRPGAVEQEQLLAIRRWVHRVEVGPPGRRHEAVRQPRIGVDRVAVRLDDVDGPRPGRGRARREAEDVDLWLASS